MTGKVEWRDIHGILLLDKPIGLTSNAALQRGRRLYRARKAGHTGSLDPLATGMLPLCFGEATKFSGHLLAADKTYEVTARWGTRTETGDADGAVVASSPVTTVAEVELMAALQAFTGELRQVPPMYSALKHQGRRLYDIARAGGEVPREARTIRIHWFRLYRFDPAAPVLQVRCSKGTYVRTLVEDLAVHLGSLAHVGALRRLAVEPFGGAAMVTLETLVNVLETRGEDALHEWLLPPDRALEGLPSVSLAASEAFSLQRGNPVVVPDPEGQGGIVRLYGPGGDFLGIGERTGDGRVQPRRLVAGTSPGPQLY